MNEEMVRAQIGNGKGRTGRRKELRVRRQRYVRVEENGEKRKKIPSLRFGLVSLFNGISTFVGYLMPKPFSQKNSSGTM